MFGPDQASGLKNSNLVWISQSGLKKKIQLYLITKNYMVHTNPAKKKTFTVPFHSIWQAM